MQTGISLASAHPTASHAVAPQRMIERARAVARTRLAYLTVGDHHVTGPINYPQNVPMLARLLAEWDTRPAGCLFLAPVWNPVLMAEQIGTLAAIAPGPFVVQTGLGDRRQLTAMGIDVPHRGRRLEASITVAQALLAGERVDHPELGIAGAAIAPQPPHGVEWWIGARTGPALDRAARLGDGWYGDAGIGADTAREQMRGYLAACERHGREPGRTLVRKDVFIAEDGAYAERVGGTLWNAGYRGMTEPDAVAFGSPEQVAEKLAVFGAIGFTDVTLRTMAGIDQADAVRSIELADRVAELLADV